MIRAGARYTLLATLAWFLFLPPLFALGVRRADQVLAVAIPVCLSAALSLVAMRQRPVWGSIECAAMSSTGGLGCGRPTGC